ncbi:hypothetical protein FJT64_001825 [Amphibalanus amphitrite]|uniref:Uncharacterized protein n=1 Tax=Amphibalanus amphitrite TaxID=1232801 RepID=A0A6A4X081_AMPAM|nr:hypothetical protein FJT64_001825 [Amphibalanus amphitrite]
MVSRWLLSALVLAAVLAGLHGVPCSRSSSESEEASADGSGVQPAEDVPEQPADRASGDVEQLTSGGSVHSGDNTCTTCSERLQSLPTFYISSALKPNMISVPADTLQKAIIWVLSRRIYNVIEAEGFQATKRKVWWKTDLW